jgi:phosphoribosylformylglycinamidine cyclo-ligase
VRAVSPDGPASAVARAVRSRVEVVSEYGKLGIDYDVLDESKRSAISFAQSTSHLLEAHGGRVVEASRGASAFVLELGGQHLAFVVEGLGTKSIIARHWLEASGEDRFADIGVDAVGAIVNDIVSVGALPLVINAYFATGRSDWHAGASGLASLLEGWRRGCELSQAAWGGGESPALPGLVSADDIELAGSAIGLVPAEWGPILGDELRDGDAIVLVQSAGLHANGASLARSVAAALPDGLLTAMPSGRRFGDALLDASVIYVPLVAELRRRAIRPSYLSHITGHGMRKLMRAPGDFTYVIDELPPVPEVLSFLSEQAGIDSREAYGTFNMGAGFAVYVAREHASQVVEAAAACAMRAAIAGRVEAGERSVEIASLGVQYRGDELELS